MVQLEGLELPHSSTGSVTLLVSVQSVREIYSYLSLVLSIQPRSGLSAAKSIVWQELLNPEISHVPSGRQIAP